MTIEDLRSFIVAYQCGNLSKAARLIGCTQAAVAQHVKRLEKELSTELFARVPRGVVPTEPGRVLYESASSALTSLESASREIRCHESKRHSRVRLAASPAAVRSSFLRPSIMAFAERHADMVLEIVPGNTASVKMDAIRDGRADLAIVPKSARARGLELRRCLHLKLALLVHHSNPLAGRKCVKAADLAGINYIAQAPDSATCRHIQQALADRGVAVEPAQIIDDPSTARLMVELGQGETFVAADVLPEAAGTEARCVKLPWMPPIALDWAARRFATLPAAALAFMEVFEEKVGEMHR